MENLQWYEILTKHISVTVVCSYVKQGMLPTIIIRLTMENLVYYVVALLMVIIGIVLIKKMAGCLVRAVVAFVLMALLAILYYKFFR